MALLWLDGFDYSTNITDIGTRYLNGGSSTGVFASSSGGRRGGRCLSGNGSPGSPFAKVLSPGDATCVVGAARSFSNLNSAYFFYLTDPTVVHASAVMNGDGSISAYRGLSSTLLGTTAPDVITVAAGFYYIEIKVTVSDTVGVFAIHVNGQSVLNLTGIDTQNGGTTAWTTVVLTQPNFTVSTIDDLYILDGTGSENNDFLGDCRVDIQLPTGNGNTSNSTPSTGTDRGAMVDDATPNGDTDYNTLVAVGDKDTLALQDMVNTGATPFGVQVSVYAKKTDAGTGSICPVLRVGATDYDGTSLALSASSYAYASQAYSRDPSGAAWTNSTFNALEVGYKRTA